MLLLTLLVFIILPVWPAFAIVPMWIELCNKLDCWSVYDSWRLMCLVKGFISPSLGTGCKKWKNINCCSRYFKTFVFSKISFAKIVLTLNVLFLTCTGILKPHLSNPFTQAGHRRYPFEILPIGIAVDVEVRLQYLQLFFSEGCAHSFRFVALLETIRFTAI